MVIQARWLIFLTLVAGIATRAAEASEWQLVQDSSNVRFIGVQEGSAFRGRFDLAPTREVRARQRFPVSLQARWGARVDDAAA